MKKSGVVVFPQLLLKPMRSNIKKRLVNSGGYFFLNYPIFYQKNLQLQLHNVIQLHTISPYKRLFSAINAEKKSIFC